MPEREKTIGMLLGSNRAVYKANDRVIHYSMPLGPTVQLIKNCLRVISNDGSPGRVAEDSSTVSMFLFLFSSVMFG